MGFAKLDSCNMTLKTIEVPLDRYSSLIINILTNQTEHSRVLPRQRNSTLTRCRGLPTKRVPSQLDLCGYQKVRRG